MRDQDHGLDQALDQTLIQLAEGALEDAHPVRLELPVRNVNRTVGHHARRRGHPPLRRAGSAGRHHPRQAHGSAGQSLGAFLPPGITIDLVGDANDYVGKGLSGGRVIVRPPDDVLFLPEDHVIAGNTLLYGATSGEVFLRGRVGERFCARNSGALAVTEGVGDHACEYMTGGRVVVLGQDRPQHGRGHVGRHRLRAGPRSGDGQHRDGRAAARSNPRTSPGCARWSPGTRGCTGSTVAASVLSDWPRRSAQFTKIMPTDYQRVLTATRMAKAEGRDVDTAIMEASRG